MKLRLQFNSRTGKAPLENGAIVFDGGEITAIGPADQIQIPQGAQVVNVQGKTIIPGLISAHSHLGLCEGALGPMPDHYNRDNVRHQLEQYERYGVLSVMALGCNKDVLYTWREEQRHGELDGADIFTADRGFGVNRGAPPFPLMEDQIYRPATAEEARAEVIESASRHPDLIKLWVDDLFGTAPKMSPDVYDAVIVRAHTIIDEAHKRAYKVAAHMFYLSDAKALVANGIDILAHSVRDQPICATKKSSEVIGASDRGTLETGKLADFVVLDGNPLDDIHNTTRIAMIYHHGKRVP
jgi:imidazolonepropionase-like amidohydrolase